MGGLIVGWASYKRVGLRMGRSVPGWANNWVGLKPGGFVTGWACNWEGL